MDITSKAFKTGIANRALKPKLGIVDTLNTRTCSRGAHLHQVLACLHWSRILTLVHVQNCTLVPVWMSCSTVWKVTLLSRRCFLPLLEFRFSRSCSYYERTPRPANPILRPAYQGSNPVADIFSLWALQTTVKNLPRVAKNRDDHEAMRQML